MAVKPFLVNGEWRPGEGAFQFHSPFDDSVVAEIGVPTEADVEEAVSTAAETFKESRHLPVHARSEALDHVSKRLGETIDENAELIAREGGKPLKWAKVEATRAVSTFRWASEVIRHGDDELMRLDTEADAFWEFGLSPWDMAAGALLILEAGGLVGDLESNEGYMESGNLCAGKPKVFAQLVQLIGTHLTPELRMKPASKEARRLA